jgi:hypothetical protein
LLSSIQLEFAFKVELISFLLFYKIFLILKLQGKRKRKQSISDNLKDDKYWERRRKNNAAAKRSREERLQKEAEVAKQATGLFAENTELKRSLAEALNDNQQLKERLAKYEDVC